MSTAAALEPHPLARRLSGLSAEARAFAAWLACWLLLPNLPFLPVTLMGGPQRYPDVIACGLVGFVVRKAGYPVRAAAFLALIVFLVINFIARMFNMALTMILSVAGLVFDMEPAASVEYLVGGGVLALVIAAGLWLLRSPTGFREPRFLLGAVAATLALGAADYLWSKDTMGAYSRLAPHGAPFASATRESGFPTLADGKTNVMLVVVEAMGDPVDPALRERLYGMWDRPELAARFEATRGETPYYGSTTSGEMRELCERWGNYPDISGPLPDCLPATLARRGYGTSAWHAFVPDFFERNRWYPLIGFQRSIWGTDMARQGAHPCPNVFPGACDRDVPRLIGKALRSADKPQFVYWLTLNSHLPIVRNKELGTLDCKGVSAEVDRDLPMVCSLFRIWGDTADALVREVSRPDFPPTHILIVGDHMPPFTHQKSRLQFETDRVPWVLLRWRGGETAQSSARAAR